MPRLRDLRIFAVYPVVAAAALAPLVRHPFTRVAAGDGSGDSFLFLWNLWWVKVAAVDRFTSPFHTDLLYWPRTTSLVLHSMSSASGLLSIPLQVAVPGTPGLVLALNLLTLLTFVLTGLGAHLLAEAGGARRPAAVLAGLVAMLLPYRLWHLNHLDLLSMQWGVFCLLWLKRALAPRAWRARVALAVFAAMTVYSDYEIAVYTVLASVFLVFWWWVTAPTREHARLLSRGLAASVALAALPILPWAAAALRLWGQVRQPAGGDLYSAGLFSFVAPGREAFLGIAFMATVAVMLVRVRHEAFRMWAALGLGFLVLSLGPTLHVGAGSWLHGLMPYAWLQKLAPPLAMSRAPVRMAGMGGVFLAIAIGVAFQTRAEAAIVAGAHRAAGSNRWWRSEWIVLTLLVILLGERWPWTPVSSIEAAVPAFYRSLATESGEFAIRPLPEDYYHRVVYMFWQTVHGRPMTSGYIGRPTDAVRASIAEWQNLAPADLADRLRSAGVRYVIIHREANDQLLTSEPIVQDVRSGGIK